MSQLLQDFVTDRNTQVFFIAIFMIVSEAAVGMFFFLRSKKFLENAISCTGKVMNIKTYSTRNGQFDRLTIAYKDSMGNSHEGQMSAAKGSHEEGSDIEFLYDPNQPEKICPNSTMAIYTIPFAMFSAAFGFGVIFIVLLTKGILKVPAAIAF